MSLEDFDVVKKLGKYKYAFQNHFQVLLRIFLN